MVKEENFERLEFAGSPRIREFLSTLEKMASGELENRLPVTDNCDELDAIAYAVNILAEELLYANRMIRESERKKSEKLKKDKETAERSSLAKSAFLANMSHEIRTPMAAILGFTDLLSRPSLSAERTHEYLRRIRCNGQQLLSLIDDILDLSKIESGKLKVNKEPSCLRSLVKEVLESLESRAMQKSLRLECDFGSELPEECLIDTVKLRQILINLVGNAIKFTSEGQIRLSCCVSESIECISLLEISVSDTGSGIAQDLQTQLFRPFVQVGDPAVGGTGLGLSLSRRLAELMGGEIELARSEENVGSTFVLRIPVVLTSGEKHRILEIDRADDDRDVQCASDDLLLQDVHVLLAEDIEDNQRIISELLISNGAKVTVANDGVDLLEKLEEQPSDIILMDLQMPRMDGLETFRQLKRQQCRIPCIALTAHAMRKYQMDCANEGFDDFITKPVSSGRLLRSIATHLGRL